MKISDLTEDGRIVKGVNTTVDVGTNEIPIQAKKFGNSVTKDGTPPSLSTKVKGKSTNVLFNLGLAEGYKLQLERDKELLVLHIKNTATGKHTEVRGKPGYETGSYDPNDKLHTLLDQLGKSVDISQLMNGEPVGINPKHPHGDKAKAATDKAYNERSSNIMREIQSVHFFEALGEIAPNTEIYVDMDGVLADFFGEWTKSQGVSNWKDIKDPMKAIGDIKSIEDFWLKLPVLPQAKNLLQLIKKVKGSYSICTSPLADDPRSEPHKREWVKKNLSFFPPKEVIVTHNKPQFAKQKDGTPNILIDDYGVNIRAWEEAGGIGFKYKDYKFQRTAKAIKQKMTSENKLLDKPTPSIKQLSKKHNVDKEDIISQIKKGVKVELEHTSDPKIALEIALDHINELPDYYDRLETVEENFADGKKKGKSRPGRVKKSGASCNGSVTDLRKRAKNASGEKAKMYHWCANMKSGRK